MADRVLVMNHGSIEQFGSPLEVYRRPATRFVADFVGEMNFLQGAAAGKDRIAVGPLLLKCDPKEPMELGTRITVGIRPEDVVIRGVSHQTVNALTARIVAIEFAGASFRASLESDELPGSGLRVGVSANALADLTLEPGTEVVVALPPDRLHLYDMARA